MGNIYARFGLIALIALAGRAGAESGAECRPDVAELRGAGSVSRFTVELADDGASRAQGLMNRPAMASSAGMLFVFDAPQHARFWMKNTLIPLDMIFIDQRGVVTAVHENAVPLDETMIDGGPGVQFILEINGGLAGPLGLRPGSVLRHPAVDQAEAAWPCGN